MRLEANKTTCVHDSDGIIDREILSQEAIQHACLTTDTSALMAIRPYHRETSDDLLEINNG
jgi:hypothetical protein